MGSDGRGKLAKATRGVKGDSAATERTRRGVRHANEKRPGTAETVPGLSDPTGIRTPVATSRKAESWATETTGTIVAFARRTKRGPGRRKPSRASVTPRGFEPRLRPRERPSPGPLRRRGPSSRSQGERKEARDGGNRPGPQ